MRFEIISSELRLKRVNHRGREQLWHLGMYWGQLFPAGTYVKGYTAPDTLALLKGAHT